jgi:5'-nucleotidase (lipoprotein e(P4) family)
MFKVIEWEVLIMWKKLLLRYKLKHFCMKKVLVFAGFILFAINFSCKNSSSNDCQKKQYGKNEYLMQSILWYQYSGEMKALYYQAYNIAKIMLDKNLSGSNLKTKKAVVVDIDETILNNSIYEGHMIKIGTRNFQPEWKKWIEKSFADTLPGALDFLKYAAGKGVEVFYISNRSVEEVAPTLKNLQKFYFPYADLNHMIFKSEKSSSKEKRRKQVSKDYEIVLLCGDNLGDFDAAFDNREEKQINDSIIKHKSEFGKRFIVLPNPIYGYWEKTILGKQKLNDNQVDSIRSSSIKSY